MGARAGGDAPGDCREIAADPDAGPDEKPLHRVTIRKPFLLAKYEVTLEEYERFAYDTGRNSPGDAGFGVDLEPARRKRLPAINVSWQDAGDYAAWLSEKTGKRFRLPSEAEWEYAARAGTGTPRFWDKLAGDACRYANVFDQRHRQELMQKYTISWDSVPCDDPYAVSAPVGSFAANAWGLHDMAGNVWEWVQDVWHKDYQGAPSDGSAWKTGGEAGRRVIRGGSWLDRPESLRAAYRYGLLPDSRDFNLGFRLAQDL